MCYFNGIYKIATREKQIILDMQLLTYKNMERTEQGPTRDEKNVGMMRHGCSEGKLLATTCCSAMWTVLGTKTKTKPYPASVNVYTQRARWKATFRTQEQGGISLQQWVSLGH